ncbi:hypothetical protein ACFTWS_34065 [Streptomyces sp. NPDC057027]|uniref:hypothetical protein n=1 Tax=Streptomyces sp. NPDC057027 TaxID=3346004 RepID=UPI00362AEA72
MRSEMQAPEADHAQAQLRVKDRFGAVLTASVSVLLVEAAIGMFANFVWEQTQENPPLPYNALTVIAVPFLAAAGAALGALVTVSLIMPLLAAAAWLGRTFSGSEVWWWVPAVTAATTAPPVLAVAILGEAGLLAAFGGWLTVATTLAVPALVARRLLLPNRPPLSGRTMFGRIALYGTLATVTAFTLVGIALYSGIGYVPPRLDAERIAGTYTDGKNGTLVLSPDGKATATRVDTFSYDSIDSFEPDTHECTGTGTWAYDPGDGPYSQQVDVSIESCPVAMDSWSVYGTREHPKLYVFIGDPDSWDLYTLRRN